MKLTRHVRDNIVEIVINKTFETRMIALEKERVCGFKEGGAA